MAYLLRSVRVCRYRTRKTMTSVRAPMIMLVICLYVILLIDPIAKFALDMNLSVTPWAFPHIMDFTGAQMIIMAGIVFIFADAPFQDDASWYMIARSGRKPWAFGHILYIILLSFFYLLLIVIASVVPIFSQLELNPDQWGKIWGTLARTDAGTQYQMIFTPNDLICATMKPIDAMLGSFLLNWVCCVWLGLMLYAFNAITKKGVGIISAIFFLLLGVMIQNEWTPDAYRFSPLTLAQLSAYTGEKARHGVTAQYSARFFAISLLILSVLCFFSASANGQGILGRIRAKRKEKDHAGNHDTGSTCT